MEELLSRKFALNFLGLLMERPFQINSKINVFLFLKFRLSRRVWTRLEITSQDKL